MLDAALLLVLAAVPVPPPASGPPLDLSRPVVHDVTMSVDVAPARDVLTLLAGGAGAPEALKRLRASRAFLQAVSRGGGNPDDILGRLVSVAAGTPDPLLSGYSGRAATFTKILDALERDGTTAGMIEARRIAALLPPGRPVTARLRVVPLFGLSRFGDVAAENDGDTLWLFVDLPGLAPEGSAELVPREVVLSLFRTAASEAWIRLFAPFRVPPAWPEPKEADFDALLARTVADGPATLFLFADEFFPLGSMFEEPIQRSFDRWNTAAEMLLDPKAKDATRREALAAATARADFWSRHSSVVGVKMTEVLLRSVGAARYLEALAAGPRAVASLYLEATRKTKEPALGKTVRKALEPAPPAG